MFKSNSNFTDTNVRVANLFRPFLAYYNKIQKLYLLILEASYSLKKSIK